MYVINILIYLVHGAGYAIEARMQRIRNEHVPKVLRGRRENDTRTLRLRFAVASKPLRKINEFATIFRSRVTSISLRIRGETFSWVTV
jgi:acetylglutamate kinase